MEKVLTHNIVQDFGISTGCEADGYGGGTLQHPADSFLVGVETWGGPDNKRYNVRCCLSDGSGFILPKYSIPNTYVEHERVLKKMEHDWGLDRKSKVPRRSSVYLQEEYYKVKYLDVYPAIAELEKEYNIEFEHDCQSFDATVKFDDIIANMCPRYDSSHLGATFAEIEERVNEICGNASNSNFNYVVSLAPMMEEYLLFDMWQEGADSDTNSMYFVAKDLESYFGAELIEMVSHRGMNYSAFLPLTAAQREGYKA
ncbi:MAG: hypothetical protein RR182_00405 [Alistipes sp.]